MLTRILLFLLLLLFTRSSYGQSTAPNVILIVADDLGWNDVSFHGSDQIPTPNLDALAYRGIILNNYYVNPICTPSRSALLTGKQPIHTGMYHHTIMAGEPWGLSLSEILLPQYLKQMGYATHIVGKWHLGYFKKEYTPTFRGFDSFLGLYNGAGDFYDHTTLMKNEWGMDIRRNLKLAPDTVGNYSTILFSDEAINVVKRHNISKPLFLYLPYQAVHSANTYEPLQAPTSTVDKFQHISDIKRRKFAGMVSEMDTGIGRLIVALNNRNMLSNSIVIFSTDNGGPPAGFNNNAASNWPLRGTKDSLWEGGVRGVGLIWSPLLKTNSRVSYQVMSIEDWMPTIYSAIGGKVSQLGNIDGKDMWYYLSNNIVSPRKEIVHTIDNLRQIGSVRSGAYKIVSGATYDKWNSWYGPPQFIATRTQPGATGIEAVPQLINILDKALVDKGFKTITGRETERLRYLATVDCGPKPNNTNINCVPKKKPCLFEIYSDPCEYNNIASTKPDIYKLLLERLQAYNNTVIPPRNLPFDPDSAPRLHDYAWTSWLD